MGGEGEGEFFLRLYAVGVKRMASLQGELLGSHV
jgi:hypothetical protein